MIRGAAPAAHGRAARPRERIYAVALLGVALFALAPRGEASRDLAPPPGRLSETGLQPFERADANFPGSAFYFLEEGAGLIDLPPDSLTGEAALAGIGLTADGGKPPSVPAEFVQTALPRAGEPGVSLRLAGTARDRLRALQCLTSAIYYEAATEPDAGQRAVAQVVLNRVAHPAWPGSVCGVVYQGSERWTGCQFTFTCDGSLARAPSRIWWERARRVAEDALAGKVYAPVGTATHYHTTEVSPHWAPSLDFIGTIGAHRFYRWQGQAGRRAAFRTLYAGGEPVPAPHPRLPRPMPADGSPDPLDPAALARSYEEARLAALAAGATTTGATTTGATAAPPASAQAIGALPGAPPARYAPPAAPVADTLPPASGIRPEYRDSGRWIARPAG